MDTETDKQNEPTDNSKSPSEKTPDEQVQTKHLIEQFEKVIYNYLASNPMMKIDKKTSELEIRFGSNSKLSKPISKIDYDNVVKQLRSCGFTCKNEDGVQMLRINSEYIDNRTGATKISNIRAEITGTDLIQEYCRTNSIQKLIDMPSNLSNKLKFTQKKTAIANNGQPIKPVDIKDFNIRVSYQMEEDFHINSNISRTIINKWNDNKKLFRSMNRVRFEHPDYPIFVDLSIVKSSKKSNYVPIPQYTIQDAGVFSNVEVYEIELEVDNQRVGTGTKYNNVSNLMAVLRKAIRVIMSGLQGSKYPITYSERDNILQEYMKLIHGEEYTARKVMPKNFIGPSSYTLQMENIQPLDEKSTLTVGNIRNQYTVTDKADGDRKLLFIAKNGHIYMIDTNMNVVFTGTYTANKALHNTLLDGEHIKYDKTRKYINLYAAFDIYYMNKQSVREYAFYQSANLEEKEVEEITKKEKKDEKEIKYRLELLNEVMNDLRPISILDKTTDHKKPTDFRTKCKNFYMNSKDVSIFECCSTILSEIDDGLFEYNTDGLIFTPADTGVGTNKVGLAGPLQKHTWDLSFKWKPAEFNTIDFLVNIKKKENSDKDEIHYIFEDGKNMAGVQEVKQYKTLILHCGYDEKKHGYLNPFQTIVDDAIPSSDNLDDEDNYKPVPFQPTSPYDPNACFCNIMMTQDGSNIYMMTEENEYFESNMIVEFKYEINNKDGWKWVPLRVRYDKTNELKNNWLKNNKNYGNAYHVANNNWHSIHHPITKEMISTGEGIPENVINEDVYYNRSDNKISIQSSTQALRDFHNVIKHKLIKGVSHRNDTLIDYAVGKAGDLPKWIRSQLSFVYGIDKSGVNIHHSIDGACARYITSRKENKNVPDALFMKGNSSVNIRNGSAFATEKEKQINRAIFGTGPKDVGLLGKAVYKHYGTAQEGFHISSCQFALHYFFENKSTLHEFLRNIAECTKTHGYFIGTCYDGQSVFNLLKKVKKEESITIMKDEHKIFEITKLYDETGFPEDEMSVGYPINVYQESINNVFKEYLVNFNYLKRIMEDYGFVLISRTEAEHMNLPNGTGLFNDLFYWMENEIKRDPNEKYNYKKALYMSSDEKRISFLNRYFIFKKVRNVNTDKIGKIISKQNDIVDKIEEEVMEDLTKEVEKKKQTITVRKTKKKVVLQVKEEENKKK
jgi:hypothetical protein